MEWWMEIISEMVPKGFREPACESQAYCAKLQRKSEMCFLSLDKKNIYNSRVNQR